MFLGQVEEWKEYDLDEIDEVLVEFCYFDVLDELFGLLVLECDVWIQLNEVDDDVVEQVQCVYVGQFEVECQEGVVFRVEVVVQFFVVFVVFDDQEDDVQECC